MDDAAGLLAAADQYEVPRLVALCEEQLCEGIDEASAAEGGASRPLLSSPLVDHQDLLPSSPIVDEVEGLEGSARSSCTSRPPRVWHLLRCLCGWGRSRSIDSGTMLIE